MIIYENSSIQENSNKSIKEENSCNIIELFKIILKDSRM